MISSQTGEIFRDAEVPRFASFYCANLPIEWDSYVIFLQGVLLLNACLTVRAREANSHKQRGWEKFTDAVVRWIDKNLSSVVFLLWGKPAQEKG